MTKRKGYQNPPTPISPVATTSPNPKTPLELDIRPGTPVTDMSIEVTGIVWGVTPAYCVMHVNEKSFWISRWENIAVGHVTPTKGCLPRTVMEGDHLDYYAAALHELDAVHPDGLPKPLRKARRFLIKQVRKK